MRDMLVTPPGERLCMRVELRDIKTSDIVQKDVAMIHSVDILKK